MTENNETPDALPVQQPQSPHHQAAQPNPNHQQPMQPQYHQPVPPQQIYVQAAQPMMYPAPEKSLGVAYLLWFFFGFLGIHQFYLGKTGRGIGYLLTFAWLTIGVWIDLFTLPAQVRAVNMQRRMGVR